MRQLVHMGKPYLYLVFIFRFYNYFSIFQRYCIAFVICDGCLETYDIKTEDQQNNISLSWKGLFCTTRVDWQVTVNNLQNNDKTGISFTKSVIVFLTHDLLGLQSCYISMICNIQNRYCVLTNDLLQFSNTWYRR